MIRGRILFKGMLIGALMMGGCTYLYPRETVVQPVILRQMWLVPEPLPAPRYVPPPDIGDA